MKKYIILSYGISLFVYTFSVIGAQVITEADDKQIFTVPVSTHAYTVPTRLFFVGADALGNGDYALAVAGPEKKYFAQLSPYFERINGIDNQENPLFNQKFNQIALFGQSPLVVIDSDKSSLYLLHNISNPELRSLYFTKDLLDAQGNVTAGIIALATNSREDERVLQLNTGNPAVFYAAVQKSGGVFGEVGSGIARGFLKVIEMPNPNKKSQEDGRDERIAILSFDGLMTTPLDVTSSVTQIETPLVSMANFAALHAAASMDTLYVGLQVQGGGASTDGAYGVVLSSLQSQVTTFTSIAQEAAVVGDNIVAARGANAQVSMHFLRSLQTSTGGLRYLVVVGGVGAPSDTLNKVYALPVVSYVDGRGTLANKNSFPVEYSVGIIPDEQNNSAHQNPSMVQRFVVTRGFDAPAQNPGDLFLGSDSAAQVGNGPAPADVTDIFVMNDAVMISTAAVGNNSQPGIFLSRALFDVLGRIKGWTEWQRVSGVVSPMSGFALDAHVGNFWVMPGATNTTEVMRTQWQEAQEGIEHQIASYFTKNTGGIQGLFDYPYTTPAFSQIIGQRLSMVVATGYKRVVIAQTGQDVSGVFGPMTSSPLFYTSDNGSLQGFVSGLANGLSITGGALNELGPIVASTIVSDGTYAWLIVGGSYGIAVLADENGAGWPAGLLQSGFFGFSSNFSFKKIGSFKNVRKLIGQAGKLYVLTNKSLKRLNASAVQFSSNSPVIDTIAKPNTLPGGKNAFFSDLVISGPLGLLGTSSGLLRVGNGQDIASITSETPNAWVAMPLPDGNGPVTRLNPISPTMQETDFALFNGTTYAGGMVYVLNAYNSLHQAHVYRLSTAVVNGVITDFTTMYLLDYFLERRTSPQVAIPTLSFFINIGNYRNYMNSDGAIFALSRSAYTGNPPLLEFLRPTFAADNTQRLRPMNGSTDVFDIPKSRAIGQLLRNSASGAWMVGGDFGLMVNE